MFLVLAVVNSRRHHGWLLNKPTSLDVIDWINELGVKHAISRHLRVHTGITHLLRAKPISMSTFTMSFLPTISQLKPITISFPLFLLILLLQYSLFLINNSLLLLYVLEEIFVLWESHVIRENFRELLVKFVHFR